MGERLRFWLRQIPLIRRYVPREREPLLEIDWERVRVEAGFAVGHLSPGRVVIAGVRRDYYVYLPASYQADKPTPMIINLHAYNAHGPKQERISRMTPLAEESGFILLYPNALGEPAQWDFRPDATRNPDLQFIHFLLEKLPEQLNINRKAIFVMGLSNGGGMAFRVACEFSEQIIGVASVAGLYPEMALCRLDRPVPAIIIHGEADSITPFYGDADRGLLAVPTWAAQWAQRGETNIPPMKLHKRWRLSSWIGPEVVPVK